MHDEFDRQLAHFLDRLDVGDAQCRLARQECRDPVDRGNGAPRNRCKILSRQLFEFVQRRLARKRQRHVVSGVVAFVKRPHHSRCRARQRVLVAGRELALAARRIVELPGHADQPARVVLHMAHRLVVNGVDFAAGEFRIEAGGDEELRKTVERAAERLVPDLEMVVRMVGGSIGVVASAVGLDEVAVLGHFRVFLGAQEQHVLQKMRQPLVFLWIVDLAGVHCERRAGLVEFRIGHQQHAQAVVEDEAAKRGGVGGRLNARRQVGGPRGSRRRRARWVGRGNGRKQKGGEHEWFVHDGPGTNFE